MGRLPKIIVLIFAFLCINLSVLSFEYENTADNPRLVNMTEKQYKDLKTIEKRLYGNSFEFENTMDRIERLEMDFFDEIQVGSVTQRLKNLKLESSRAAVSGTAMTPMMQDTFNPRYVSSRFTDTSHYNDVGIIDGLIRVWWPDLFAELSEYRKYKEACFY